jgi:ubiquinone/menaquinone biosynthesis C-methylase UbiE
LKSIFDFNQYNRDMWVEGKAKKITLSKILDAGAGTGRYKKLFDHCEYYSTDFCRERSTLYSKMDFVSDIMFIPICNESFDVVLCTEVLEHTAEPIRIIEEFGRILKVNGILLLTAPLGAGLHQEPFIYYGGFTPYWYRKFLTKYGFRNIKIMPNGGFFRHYGQESQRFLSYISTKNGLIKMILFPYFKILMPIVCHILDRLDKDNRFTVGYFVEAIKQGDSLENS